MDSEFCKGKENKMCIVKGRTPGKMYPGWLDQVQIGGSAC